MPKLQSTQQEPTHTKETIEQKLDRIAESLSRLDRRDKIRTSWMTIRSIISIIPLLAIIGGALYLYWKGDDLLQNFTGTLAKQFQIHGLQTGPLLKQFEQFLR
ncbi:hypothetical protein A3H22_01905 [Candidatus Peribacteria bacterium RIFCSPLOWO2_12_FULL_55_15]|nr:MAG: hypothetical protein A2789_03185 [Candidatus Peribacteria bacterium RIFCSPHIGHO2_01_FULL_54_22]OGJ62400.1 MAG: hypothetical protein A3D12_01240 [Candidatus Peribacteria bacterium RIFCSPHIGHO2_02_FULL_55_24]OGJ63979.1 MAG: hypothetical protein A3E47_02610 [Candidatus Peribacteria bacterium RIFCSPHIGHO2_12_FULL_54_10]OGJ67901.1 MAG: hypothetical protein A2947_03620 [Candidatus Peribacteria bacterium RIFCSPLOWO2_01_FULL_54_110]OGJ70438.1 MAG: hypothetical protein A3H90_04100 [Candidatus Pe